MIVLDKKDSRNLELVAKSLDSIARSLKVIASATTPDEKGSSVITVDTPGDVSIGKWDPSDFSARFREVLSNESNKE